MDQKKGGLLQWSMSPKPTKGSHIQPRQFFLSFFFFFSICFSYAPNILRQRRRFILFINASFVSNMCFSSIQNCTELLIKKRVRGNPPLSFSLSLPHDNLEVNHILDLIGLQKIIGNINPRSRNSYSLTCLQCV